MNQEHNNVQGCIHKLCGHGRRGNAKCYLQFISQVNRMGGGRVGVKNIHENPHSLWMSPDTSGQALGFNSCFTAFLPFTCALIISLIFLVGECFVRVRYDFI